MKASISGMALIGWKSGDGSTAIVPSTRSRFGGMAKAKSETQPRTW
jgi:hypothetical protein